MGLFAPIGSSEVVWQVSNVDNLQPQFGIGAEVFYNATAGLKGAWVEVLSPAEMANAATGFYLNINTNGGNDNGFNSVLDVGIDSAGGTSYVVIVPDLMITGASPWTANEMGNWYFLPMAIPLGSRVAVRAARSISGAGASFFAIIRAFGRPRDATLVWSASVCTPFGMNAAVPIGTTVISGEAAEGAWTLLAAAIPKSYRFWQVIFGCGKTNTDPGIYSLDLACGDATNKEIILRDVRFTIRASDETISAICRGAERYVAAGNDLYARLQCSTTAMTELNVAAYGFR